MVPKQLIEEIKEWIKIRRYGNIQINFVRGRILSWNLHISMKPDESPAMASTKIVSNNNGDKKNG